MGELEGYAVERELVEGGDERVGTDELTEFMSYYCAEWNNKDATVAGKLIPVNFYHEQRVGVSLPVQQSRIKAVKKGIKRAHVEAGNQTRVRRPLTWETIRVMEESIGEWSVGGRIAWIGLALSHQLLLRALFSGERGGAHHVYCFRRGNIAFF